MRVAILVLLMVSFSPAAHAVGGEEPEEIPTVVLEDILGTYSRSVQIAFERVSDIDSYEEAELAVVDSWLVVTGIPIKEHRWTEAEPEESKPVEHLRFLHMDFRRFYKRTRKTEEFIFEGGD